jgi:hypothetical protein
MSISRTHVAPATQVEILPEKSISTFGPTQVTSVGRAFQAGVGED